MALYDLKVISGSAHPELASEICRVLGIPQTQATLGRFSDGETSVEILDNVRGLEVFVVQPTCSPANDNIMELLILADALRRASARGINAVIPYFGYARQDRKVRPRTPITAKLVSNLLAAAGVTRVLSMDLHAGQIQGFFDVPFDHLYGSPVLLQHIREHFNGNDVVVVSPDAGGTELARAYSKHLNASLAIIDKRRPRPNVAQVMNIIGDVKDKIAIVVDDMIDTAGTLTSAAQAVMNAGAKRVFAYATHPVFSGPAIERISSSVIEKVVVTDTVPLSPEARACGRIEQLGVARLLAEAMKRIHEGDSVSSLFV